MGSRRGRVMPSLSEFNVPLTAQHLHLRLTVLNTSTVVPYGRGSIQRQQPEMKMLWAVSSPVRGVHRSSAQLLVPPQHGVLGRGTTPPWTPTAPLGGGGQAAMQWAACCPPTGAQVTGETRCCGARAACAHLQAGLRSLRWGGCCADAWCC